MSCNAFVFLKFLLDLFLRVCCVFLWGEITLYPRMLTKIKRMMYYEAQGKNNFVHKMFDSTYPAEVYCIYANCFVIGRWALGASSYPSKVLCRGSMPPLARRTRIKETGPGKDG